MFDAFLTDTMPILAGGMILAAAYGAICRFADRPDDDPPTLTAFELSDGTLIEADRSLTEYEVAALRLRWIEGTQAGRPTLLDLEESDA